MLLNTVLFEFSELPRSVCMHMYVIIGRNFIACYDG